MSTQLEIFKIISYPISNKLDNPYFCSHQNLSHRKKIKRMKTLPRNIEHHSKKKRNKITKAVKAR